MSVKGVDLPTALQRYLAAAERSYYKAHHELTAARAQRSQGQAAEARTEAAQARRESAELEKALLNYIYAPPPVRPKIVTMEAKEPGNCTIQNEATASRFGAARTAGA
jgi:hypothetical protein